MYHHLRPSEIRLMQIQEPPSERHNQAAIVCELVPVTLSSENVPPYTALSYVWGSAVLMREVIVAGQPVQVTENLFLILQALSLAFSRTGQLQALLKPPAEQYFWIDGLCINQNDTDEKAVQVEMMGDIYRRASMTLMWLGDLIDERRQALEWFIAVARLDDGIFEEHVKLCRLHELFNGSAWDALCDFLVQQYFRRRWIIQEIALSPDPWLVCGGIAVDWRTIEIGYDRVCCKMFNEVGLNKAIKTTDIEWIAAVLMLRWRARNRVDSTLLEILVRLRRCDTTQPRDRIFAVRALCSDAERSQIPVTYEEGRPIADVFAQQVVAHIRTQRNLDILCVCQDRIKIKRPTEPFRDSSGLLVDPDPPGWAKMTFLPELPTWVPNWTSPRAHWHLSSDHKAADAVWRPLYSASGNIPPLLPDLDQAVQTKLLTATGVHVDDVWYIEETTPPSHPDQRNPASNFYRFCFMLYQRIPLHMTPFRTEAHRLDSFWRTITLGGRKFATNDFFTMEFIRYRCLEYFQGPEADSLFGTFLAHLGFHRLPEPSLNHWFTRENVPAVYFEANQHHIDFDHLTAFRFFVTKSGRMGLGPPHTQSGDHVCVLFGCSSPILLHGCQGRYQVRGETYVDGYMRGEATQMLQDRLLHRREFPIV